MTYSLDCRAHRTNPDIECPAFYNFYIHAASKVDNNKNTSSNLTSVGILNLALLEENINGILREELIDNSYHWFIDFELMEDYVEFMLRWS